MLYPRENRVRGVIDLGGVWNFKLGDEKEPGDSFVMGEDTELMAVPASYNDQKDDPKYRNHYGWAYYERKITVPSYLKGQRLVLRFDAVTHAAKVYLNGRFLTAHKGGFLPFEVDVTDQLVPGETAELVVAADNRVNHSTLPVGNEGSTAFFGSDNPGVPSVEAAKVWRKPQNLPNFDFFNYAGINRPVRIYTTPAAYIDDITLVPDIDGDTGVVNYEIKTAGSVCEDEVRIRILDADGNEVAAADGAGGTVRIPDASHYPYAEEMYQLCDREGIVVIDETPAVGIGAGDKIDPYKTFHIREHHEQVLREMIARDKNHPCVVMWSMGNEPDTEHFPESAYDYWHSLYELTHSLDPADRPVTFVCCQNNYERDLVTRTMDVVCVNRYYGWYNLSGDLDAACYALNMELDFWEKQNKPVMITEYGADAVAGIHESVPEMFSEEFQMEYYRRQNAEFDKRSFFIGEQVWNFADFATIQGCMRADGNKKGLFTRDRRPKMAAHYFKERWGQIPNFEYK